MFEDGDFDLLDNIIQDNDEVKEPVDVEEPDHPVIAKSSWSTHHNKFTRKLTNDKNIFQDVQGLGLTDEVINTANQIYQTVTGSRIIRGKSRRGIICTCVYYAFNQIDPNAMSYDETIKIFKIENKVALKGFKFVNGTNNCAFTCFTSTPETYIKLFLKKFNVDDEETEDVLRAYQRIKDIDLSSRPRPQSMAAAFIFYWLKIFHKGKIKIEYLTLKTGVSQLTIEKLEKEIRLKIDLIQTT